MHFLCRPSGHTHKNKLVMSGYFIKPLLHPSLNDRKLLFAAAVNATFLPETHLFHMLAPNIAGSCRFLVTNCAEVCAALGGFCSGRVGVQFCVTWGWMDCPIWRCPVLLMSRTPGCSLSPTHALRTVPALHRLWNGRFLQTIAVKGGVYLVLSSQTRGGKGSFRAACYSFHLIEFALSLSVSLSISVSVF